MRATLRPRASPLSPLVSPRGALAFVIATALALPSCDCGGEPSLPDAGGFDAGKPSYGRDGGQTQGEDGGVSDDGGSEGPAPTLEQLARELCLAYARGLLNLERHRALETPPPRCSSADLAPDVRADEPLPVGTCAAQDPLRELFLRALGGGRVAIDFDAFRSCLAKGRALRASTPTLGDLATRAAGLEALALDEDCQAAITPLVTEEGAPCVQAWDCAAPLACQADPLDSFSLKCLPPALEGARCDEDPPSADVLPLRTCAEGLACVLGVCTARLTADAACTDGGVPCAEGLTCRAEGTCGVPSSENGPCLDSGDCAEGLSCDVSSQVCVPVRAPLPDGEACVSSSECAGLCSVCRPDEGGGTSCQDRAPAGGSCSAHDHCRAGLFCDVAEGRCAPYREVGESCDGASPCAAGLVCTDQLPPPGPDAGPTEPPADGGISGPVCQRPRRLGEGCERVGLWRCEDGLACVDGVCHAGAFDDPCLVDGDCREDALCVANTCVRAPRAGAPCTSDGRCDEDLICRENRCRELPPAGEACTADRRCGAGAFCPDGENTCQALRPPGQPCTADGQCRTGICLDTLTCGADGASCLSTGGAFAQLVGLGFVLPLLSLARRRRRR